MALKSVENINLTVNSAIYISIKKFHNKIIKKDHNNLQLQDVSMHQLQRTTKPSDDKFIFYDSSPKIRENKERS
jgi:hypothetical protein